MKMIEKISRALCIEESQDPDKMFGGGPGWKVYEHLALAAIKAMRESTDDQYDAGHAAFEKDEYHMSVYHCVGEAYKAMIDAALKEGEE